MLPLATLSVLSRYASLWLVPWVLAAMTSLQRTAPWSSSYPDVAAAIAAEASAHPLYPGPDGAQRTAALLVSWTFRESRFDAGAVGDHGAARGLMQPHSVHAPDADLTDPATNLAVAGKLLRDSAWVCRARPEAERWAWYIHGRAGCPTDERSLRISRARSAEAAALLRNVVVEDVEDED